MPFVATGGGTEDLVNIKKIHSEVKISRHVTLNGDITYRYIGGVGLVPSFDSW